MTYGEQSELVYSFITSYIESDNPEEILERENIVSSFIEFLDENELREFRQDYEILRTDEMFKNQEPFRTLENYLYEEVLGLKTDVKTEYLLLKNQVKELYELIESRKRGLKSRLSENGNSKSTEYQKNRELLSQIGQIEKKVRDKSKTSDLIQMAISNSRNTFQNRFLLYGREDFSRYEWQIRFQKVNVRKYINFGLLPVYDTDTIMKLKNTDYTQYLACFKKIIKKYKIVDRIKESINSNLLIRDRAHIVAEACAYLKKNDYQMFVNIIVPQIEGFFRIYMKAMHIQKQIQSIGDVVKEINEKDRFVESLYFRYDFSDIRNQIAHGDVMNPSEEQAYEILMDLHWIVTKLDSDEMDYKKWMSWLNEFSLCDTDEKRILRILEYFKCGLEMDERLDNLKLYLNHQYCEVINIYGLSEVGECFFDTLKCKDLYSEIWNEDTPLKVEESCDENLKSMVEETPEQNLNENKDFQIVRRNYRPIEYGAFVELLHKNELCQDEWYKGYRAFVDEQEKE